MRIAVWGLGYVGTVSAACLAELGHDVVGVDISEPKVETIRQGRSPVLEPGLEPLVAATVRSGRLRPTSDPAGVVAACEVSLVCVGTPAAPDGTPMLEHLLAVCRQIGEGLRGTRGHVVVVRSTVFPGTCRGVLVPLLEQHSGLSAGEGFGIVANPEFLREASALADFRNPTHTILGASDERAGEIAARLYGGIDAPIVTVTLEEAEMLKLACNAFHGLKVGFANEIGRLGERLSIDPERVMSLLRADTRLNASPAYLRPGFAFGGSCLPKDLRALVHNGRRLGVSTPILEGVLRSNGDHLDAVRSRIAALGVRRVAVLGLAFKPGTDDLRESPSIDLVRALWQDGFDVRVHDPDVRLEEMVGGNRKFLERQLPQVREILYLDPREALRDCEAVVITQRRREFAELARAFEISHGPIVLDCAGALSAGEPLPATPTGKAP
jgi:GDP-mannose 6-dehydrogenase